MDTPAGSASLYGFDKDRADITQDPRVIIASLPQGLPIPSACPTTARSPPKSMGLVMKSQTSGLSHLHSAYTIRRLNTWDEAKRQQNLQDHGIDLADLDGFSDGAVLKAFRDRAAKPM